MFTDYFLDYCLCTLYAVFITPAIVCSCRQVAGIITQPLDYFLQDFFLVHTP